MAGKEGTPCSQHVIVFGLAAIVGLQLVVVLQLGGIIPARQGRGTGQEPVTHADRFEVGSEVGPQNMAEYYPNGLNLGHSCQNYMPI